MAAGLDGIERGIDPDEAASGDTSVPRTLLEAVQALEADPVLTALLDGPGGAGVADYYAALKREEFYSWHNQVTAWELDRYLTAV